ncbi:MAG TPA: sulfur carrier protein ThiS [Planctomycetota bacterium]|nr:sulfur carrier protein ThiS [Planctomycetota bacterium]
MIRVVVNGRERVAEDGATVRALLEALGVREGAPAAVEVNRKVVPRAAFPEHRLAEGDQVEVVTLVGGG